MPLLLDDDIDQHELRTRPRKLSPDAFRPHLSTDDAPTGVSHLDPARRAQLGTALHGPLYDRIAQPLAFLGLHVVVGVFLILEGWRKITAPFDMGV